MSIEFKCNVTNVENSYIPGVKILSMECGKTLIKIDIHKDLSLAEKGDTINLGLYKSVPQYAKGIDFVAHGYVIAKRREDPSTKIYISLWGYLIIILTTDSALGEFLEVMDKVYVRMWK